MSATLSVETSANPSYYIGECRFGYFEKHGVCWRVNTRSIHIELACFREKMAGRMELNLGGVGPSWHFKAIAMCLWPEGATDGGPRFIWNSWADRMLRAACKNRYLAIAGSGGFGKSEFFAVWLIINFICDPANTMCLATSITVSVSKKKLWGKVVSYWTPLEKLGFPGKLVDSLHIIRYVNEDGVPVKGDLAGIALVVGERKKEKEAVGRLLGIHQDRIIFVADDLTELSEAVTEAAIYNMSRGCTFFQFVGIANPYSFFDPFGKFAAPKDGDWQKISVDMDEWETERGVCIHFDALKNPRITEGDERLVWMDSQEAIDAEMEIHGGNSASFWRMYRGYWSPSGVTELIYTEIEIVNAQGDRPADWIDPYSVTRVCFLDPSFTSGGDRTVAYFGSCGMAKGGLKTLQYDKFFIFKDDVTDKTQTRSQQVIRWWRNLCEANQVTPRHAGFDCTGAGGPFGDIVDILWSKEVLKVNFAGAASAEKVVSAYDSTLCKDRYYNKVAEVWYGPKESLRTGQIRGLCGETIREMCMRKKTDKNESHLIRIESKREMMVHTETSPDIADAAMGLHELCIERLGFNSGVATRQLYPQQFTPQFKKLFAKYDAFADIRKRTQPNPFDFLQR
jgi:hypothetical protein